MTQGHDASIGIGALGTFQKPLVTNRPEFTPTFVHNVVVVRSMPCCVASVRMFLVLLIFFGHDGFSLDPRERGS